LPGPELLVISQPVVIRMVIMRTLGATVVLALLLVAGCAPAPQPFRSPLALTFASPLPEPPRQVYLPRVAAVPSKKGVSLACGYDDPARMAREVAALNVAWVWNWGPTPPLFPDVESVPCIWDDTVIGATLGGNSEWVIGPNECDQHDQCNRSPEYMARAWAELERVYPDRKLTSPQVVRWDRRWLEEWYAAYQAQNGGRAPRLDAIAIHTYWGNDITAYQEQVRYYIALAQRWGVKEVWITEFAIAPGLDRTVQATVDDLRAYIAWLDAQPMVTRYAVWTNRVECTEWPPDSLFDTPLYGANGMMTELGKTYASIGRE
jgi:hypothetical protein